MRTLAALVALSALATPALAQQHQHPAAPAAAAAQAELPEGWQMRLDRPNQNAAEISFRTMDPGWHVTTGPAAIFWRPDMVATGSYRAEAKIHLMKPAQHPEAFGFFLGGADLAGPNQDYLYFLVRQDGKYLIKHRAGSETHTLVEWTEHPAVQKPSAEGSAANVLAVEVGEDDVAFFVNGTEVDRLQRAPMLNTDGIVGLRVNHRLDTHVEYLKVEPKQ